MPRNGSGVYSKAAGTTAVSNTTIESAKYNAAMDDLVEDLNTPRPIVAGGTGAATADGALTALGGGAFGVSVFKSATNTNVFKTLDTKAAVLADTALSYSGSAAVTAGALVTTRKEGNVYVVAASDATDYHLTTAGSVKLYDQGTYSLPAVEQTQIVMDRLERGLVVDIIVCGDSTGVGEDAWPHELGVLLGAAYPNYTVIWYPWVESEENYDGSSVIQAGTGGTPPELHIWNASISGSVANRFAGPEMVAAIRPGVLGRDPDLVMINYGHNGGSIIGRQLPMMASSIGAMKRYLPLTPFIIVGQNPVTTDDTMRPKITAWQMLAKEAGCGFINVHAFFEDYSQPSWMGDILHPSALGYQAEAFCISRAFVYSPDAARVSANSTSNRGVIIAREDYAWFNGWTKANVTVSEETSIYETAGSAMKITGNGSSSVGVVSKQLISGNDIKAYYGRHVTIQARIYVPSGNAAVAGTMLLDDGVGTASTADGGPQGTGFVDVSVALKIDPSSTGLSVLIYTNNGSASSEWIVVDRLTIVDGLIPRDGIPTVKPSEVLSVVTNGNGTSVRFINGVQMCWKSTTLTGVTMTTAFGGGFRSGDLSGGSWAQTFATIGHADVRPAWGSPTVVLNFGALSTSSAPTFQLMTGSSIGTPYDIPITIMGVGTWA